MGNDLEKLALALKLWWGLGIAKWAGGCGMPSPYPYPPKIFIPTTYPPSMACKIFTSRPTHLGMHSNSSPPTMANWVYPSPLYILHRFLKF